MDLRDFIVDFNTSYRFTMNRCVTRVFLKVNNLFNADYMQMQWYPMPPVNFEAGVNLHLLLMQYVVLYIDFQV